MHPSDAGPWLGDWIWSLPLIVVTVVIHVGGLALVGERVTRGLGESSARRHFILKFAIVMSETSLEVTALHALETFIWAEAFEFLGAMPDHKSAMLYSLSAMTTYGHASLYLKPEWQLMGALEALNGMLLFGLTTAFLFAMIQRVWPMGSSHHHAAT